MVNCPFCLPAQTEIICESPHCFAFRDGFPVSRGHTLIVPRRHVDSFFDLTPEEQAELFQLASQCKASLDTECAPDGYTIGINDGVAAGQTIMHVHLHLIPRYDGDQADPRGGVRRVIPEKAAYWEDEDR